MIRESKRLPMLHPGRHPLKEAPGAEEELFLRGDARPADSGDERLQIFEYGGNQLSHGGMNVN